MKHRFAQKRASILILQSSHLLALGDVDTKLVSLKFQRETGVAVNVLMQKVLYTSAFLDVG